MAKNQEWQSGTMTETRREDDQEAGIILHKLRKKKEEKNRNYKT